MVSYYSCRQYDLASRESLDVYLIMQVYAVSTKSVNVQGR